MAVLATENVKEPVVATDVPIADRMAEFDDVVVVALNIEPVASPCDTLCSDSSRDERSRYADFCCSAVVIFCWSRSIGRRSSATNCWIIDVVSRFEISPSIDIEPIVITPFPGRN